MKLNLAAIMILMFEAGLAAAHEEWLLTLVVLLAATLVVGNALKGDGKNG